MDFWWYNESFLAQKILFNFKSKTNSILYDLYFIRVLGEKVRKFQTSMFGRLVVLFVRSKTATVVPSPFPPARSRLIQ